jgi:hypothetical protein
MFFLCLFQPWEEEDQGASSCVMKPRILSWHVRGLNSFLACEGVEQEEKTLRVSNLLKDWKVDVICFQETKLHSLSRYLVRSLWRCNHIDWCTLDSSGASGGILKMWDTRVVEKVDECVGEFTLAISVKTLADNFSWACAGVYGPNSGCDRRRLWDELAGICSWWDSPWCIGGDFNVTRFPSERSSEAHLCSAMTDFFDFIADQGLMDLPLGGGSFTWLISHDPPVRSRIDCFLVSHDWEVQFLLVSQKRLSRLFSDHFPILVDCGDISRGSMLFKFETMWLKVEGFVGLVKQWRDS